MRWPHLATASFVCHRSVGSFAVPLVHFVSPQFLYIFYTPPLLKIFSVCCVLCVFAEGRKERLSFPLSSPRWRKTVALSNQPASGGGSSLVVRCSLSFLSAWRGSQLSTAKRTRAHTHHPFSAGQRSVPNKPKNRVVSCPIPERVTNNALANSGSSSSGRRVARPTQPAPSTIVAEGQSVRYDDFTQQCPFAANYRYRSLPKTCPSVRVCVCCPWKRVFYAKPEGRGARHFPCGRAAGGFIWTVQGQRLRRACEHVQTKKKTKCSTTFQCGVVCHCLRRRSDRCCGKLVSCEKRCCEEP